MKKQSLTTKNPPQRSTSRHRSRYRARKQVPRKRSRSDSEQIFRSRLERDVADDLTLRGVGYGYEPCRVRYVSARSYIPDFILPNNIYIEVKGWFRASDRAKHLRIKEQHPELDIRFVFGRAGQKLSRQSSTTYSQWCERYGFQWSEKVIPQGWLNEESKTIREQQQQQQLFAT